MSKLKMYMIMDKITNTVKKEILLEKNDMAALRTYERYKISMKNSNRFYREEEEALLCIGCIDENEGIILSKGEEMYYYVESIEGLKYKKYDEEEINDITVDDKETAKRIEKNIRS